MLSCTDDTPATHIYTLSLHDALPIYDQLVEEGKLSPADLSRSTFYRYLANQPLLKSSGGETGEETKRFAYKFINELWQADVIDRKSTRLNSSHVRISYAVFCLKKKNP